MSWDVDGNGNLDALTDGKLILAYLFGIRGEALIRNSLAPDATRTEAAQIIAYLEEIRDQLDVDGNGMIDALTDAILYLRYLFGFTGEALTSGAVGAGATRANAEQVIAYLESIGSGPAIDPIEVRSIEENNALDVELAIERASDRNRYTSEELAATREWVIGIAQNAQIPDNLTSLDFENARSVENSPNTFIVELSDDAQTTDAFGELDSSSEIEFFYPLVPLQIELDYIPNDPLFADQWHFRNTGQTRGTPGVDANITAAWDVRNPRNPSQTVRGRGVVIGIVDEGLEFTHPDIANRYRSDLSNDFKDNDRDPSPNSPDEKHGTAVAGVAAAGDNGMGVTGAAPEAFIAGLRLIGGNATDDRVADTLGWKNQEIDIYQNSWSPRNFTGQDKFTVERIQEGIAKGRSGRGSVYVYSAGNNRQPLTSLINPLGFDNVNYNGLANSRYTIAVGAIDHNGVHARYSEPGAPLLISAPSSNGGTVGVTTTGLVGTGNVENNYRDDFGGTSAAAPLVSGIIAMMLEANPELGWRDVQHIIVETAVQNDPSNPDWVINGGGKHVNYLYGFGLIDAAAAVEMAIDWTPVDPELLITEEFTGGLRIPDDNPAGVETAVTFNSDIKVEWAEVVLQATHPRRGELEVVLVSPDGTESILAEPRDDFSANYDWTFTSARHWGESSTGEWTLRVSDISSDNTGTLDSAELRLYGTVNEVVDANQPPIAINDSAITDENSSVTIAVLVNDLDPDGDLLSLTGVSSPGNGSANISNNQIIYSPAANFVGNDSFNYTISDGSLTATATVNVTIEGANQPPIAFDDTAATTEEIPVRIEVLANDADPDGDAISIAGFATISITGGTIAIDDNGTPVNPSDDLLLYTPGDGFTGTDSFFYTISDGNLTSTAAVNVTIEPVNEGPRSFPAVFELADIDGNNGFIINGSIHGASVSDAGDVNGDGIGDLIIGRLEVYVVFGSNQGFSTEFNLSDLDGSNGFAIPGLDPDNPELFSVSGAGDINGDGFDDLLIGAPAAGESYVIFGGNQGFSASFNLSEVDGSNGFLIPGIEARDLSGRSVSAAGDINGDGIDDIVIGAPRSDSQGNYSGASYVVFGRNQGFGERLNLSELNGENGFAVNAIEGGDFSGWSVSATGDINGDAIDDLLISALRASPNGNDSAGQSYVVFGKNQDFSPSLNLSDLDGSNGFVINGINADDRSGRSVSGAGDINGDGLNDLIIAGYNVGESYVVFGNNQEFNASLNLSDLNGSNGFVISGIEINDDFSGLLVSVSGAGDINNDGIDDLIIGAPDGTSNNVNTGKVYVVFGSNQGFNANLNLSDLDGTNGFTMLGNNFTVGTINAFDRAGGSVSGAGDVNGDGIDDIIISTYPNIYPGGKSYVVMFTAIDDENPADNHDNVSISTTQQGKESDGSPTLFTLTRIGEDLSSELTVNLILQGTALPGLDYTAPANLGVNNTLTATFAAGSNTASLSLPTLEDSVVDSYDRILAILRQGNDYSITPGGDRAEAIIEAEGVAATASDRSYPYSNGGEHGNSSAFAALKTDGSLVTWVRSPDNTDQLNSGVVEIFSTGGAFAALKEDGSVVTWGGFSDSGGDSSSVANQLNSSVTKIFSTGNAFAALKEGGSVVTWGNSDRGGDSNSVASQLNSGVTQIFSNDHAFAALKEDGSVVTWGDNSNGGDSSSVADHLNSDVKQIFSTLRAFAALKEDGSVVTWGLSYYGGDSSNVADQLSSGVTQIFSTWHAFAAVKEDGSVVTWGLGHYGGNSSNVADQLSSGVTQIFSTYYTFAALKEDGSVVTWSGSSDNNIFAASGDSSNVADQLSSGVTQIFSNAYAFAALKEDGSVVTWGASDRGGDSSSVANQLNSGVTKIISTLEAFAALKEDGSVVTWGNSDRGGDSSSVADQINSGVTHIFSTGGAFAALKEDGSVVTWGVNGGDSSRVADQLSSGVVAFATPFTDDRLTPNGDRSADILTGTPGIPDTFSLSSSQTVAIEGFVDGEDVLHVSGGLTFSDLNVTAGTGSSIGNTLIAIESSNQVIAELIGVQSVSIAQQDFIFV